MADDRPRRYMFPHFTFQVYRTTTRGGGDQLPTTVFLSIPKEVVATSARHLLSTRSLRIEVPFADVSSLQVRDDLFDLCLLAASSYSSLTHYCNIVLAEPDYVERPTAMRAKINLV